MVRQMGIVLLIKIEQGMRIETTRMRNAVLKRKIRENCTEKVIFEQRTKGAEGKAIHPH